MNPSINPRLKHETNIVPGAVFDLNANGGVLGYASITKELTYDKYSGDFHSGMTHHNGANIIIAYVPHMILMLTEDHAGWICNALFEVGRTDIQIEIL